jgi:chitin disaccharide deacetylase
VNRVNTLLGFPDDARLLIVNADDFGMCGAVNQATVAAFAAGVVGSTTLMVPWPGAAQAMRLLREHPDLPFGVHLTAVCDMVDYRWGPLTPGERVPSLIDQAGHFHGLERLSEFLTGLQLEELELEFRAQIESVLASGLRPTHLDWHCLHNGGRADIFDMTLALAREYGLALRVSDPPSIQSLRRQGLPTDDHELLDSYALEPAGKSARYAQMLRELPSGLSEWAVHPGLGNAELRAIEPDSWQVRQTDYDFLVSSDAREIIRQEGIVLLSYRPLQELWRAS